MSARKIIRGLNDVLAFVQGDESRAVAYTLSGWTSLHPSHDEAARKAFFAALPTTLRVRWPSVSGVVPVIFWTGGE